MQASVRSVRGWWVPGNLGDGQADFSHTQISRRRDRVIRFARGRHAGDGRYAGPAAGEPDDVADAHIYHVADDPGDQSEPERKSKRKR